MAKFSSHSASTSLLSLPTSSNHFKRTSSSFFHFPQHMGALTITLSTRLTDGIGSLIRNISVPTRLRQLTVDPLICIDKQYKVVNDRSMRSCAWWGRYRKIKRGADFQKAQKYIDRNMVNILAHHHLQYSYIHLQYYLHRCLVR
nr:unnamed protein product [Callosobruchus chinensis]